MLERLAQRKFFGSLCGASTGEVDIEDKLLDLMRKCARLLGQRVRRSPTGGRPPGR